MAKSLLVILSIFLFVIALAAPVRAAVWRYMDAEGREVITNDPSSVPLAQRGSLEQVDLKKLREEKLAERKAAQEQSQAAPEDADSLAGESASSAGGAAIVSRLMGGAIASIARHWIVDPSSGLIQLPDSLSALEKGARPYLRVMLLLLLGVAVGLFIFRILRHFGSASATDIANNPIIGPMLKLKGPLFALGIFGGGYLAYLTWHAAQLDWKEQTRLMWEGTAGALMQETGNKDGVLRVALSNEVVELHGPAEMMQKYHELEDRYRQDMNAAEKDAEYLTALCGGEIAPESPQQLLGKLLNMDSGLKAAKRTEDDIGIYRNAAARIGFSLGEDITQSATSQERMKRLHEQIESSQKACKQLSLKGHQMRNEALEGDLGQ